MTATFETSFNLKNVIAVVNQQWQARSRLPITEGARSQIEPHRQLRMFRFASGECDR